MESTLVTVNDIKQYTSIGSQVDPEVIFPFILLGQQLYVQPVLGDALYNDIISRFDNNQLTGDTQTLYEEYLISAISYSGWYAAAPFLNYKTQRSGISTQSSDVLTPVTPEELDIYLTKVNNFKDYYLNRLEKYLVANSTLFPLFRRNDIIESNGSTIYLGFKTTKKNAPYWDRDYYGNDIID